MQGAGLKWLMVHDEYGRDPALELEGTSVLIFPLTMISKRVEAGETVDVCELYRGVCSRIGEIADVGRDH